MGKEKESHLKTTLAIPEKTIEEWWPHLRLDNHHETSKKDDAYNCIAWAAGIDDDKWAPYEGYYWMGKKKSFPDGNDLPDFIKGFESLGYVVCDNAELEEGYVKVAFYVNGNDVRHMARQLENGHWTSKLGELWHDIEHYSLNVLESDENGEAKVFMKQKRSE